MLWVKVVCLEVLYHPSNFLPSLKKHPVYKKVGIFHVEFSRDWLSQLG